MPRPLMPSLFDKLWDRHAIAETPGGATIIAIDRIFLHERTGAAALASLAAAGRKVADPARAFAAMDHIVDTFPGRSDVTTIPGGSAFITAGGSRGGRLRSGATAVVGAVLLRCAAMGFFALSTNCFTSLR